MAILEGDYNHLVQIFGILGNIVSCLVYLAPLPTFRQIYRKKSTLEYHSLPYVVALFSAMLWMYYAFIGKNAMLLITINSVGSVIETLYIIVFLKYASSAARRSAIKQIVSLNVCCFGFVLLFTFFLFGGDVRVKIVAWICVVIACCVFAAPLAILWKVVKTQSVEFMPFALSFFLTLSAVMWFGYGLFKKDWFVAFPNIIGFILGLIQMVLYGIYRNGPKTALEEEKIPEHVINMVMLSGPEVHPVGQNTGDIEHENSKVEGENDEKGEACAYEMRAGPPLEDPTRAAIELGPSPPMLVVCAA